MSDTRRRIVDAVRESPGIHFNGLVRRLDLATGQVQYHIKSLLAEESIVATDLYGRTHYYPAGFDEPDRRQIALLRRETTRDIVAALLEQDHAKPGAITAELGVARSTVEWHLDRLMEQDLVEKHRDDGNRVTLALTRPEATAELLATVDPSLLDSMVSRYTKLLDDVFDSDPS